jgi:sterol desaturase/sphingolipid hydroxylase (fatty acid hydroxylase superfamily)
LRLDEAVRNVQTMPRRVSAQSLRTKRAAARELLHHGSPYVLVVVIAACVAARTRAGGPIGMQDGVALVAVLLARPFVEWGLHRIVLHGPARTIAGRTVDPGASHRGHHQEPDDVAGALLGTPYAIADSLAIVAATAAVGAGFVPFTGTYPFAGVMAAAAAAGAGLLWYEWAHLLFHTGYRPRTSWFRRLRTNHRRHHYRDERRWLGVTSMIVDRLAGTHDAVRAPA